MAKDTLIAQAERIVKATELARAGAFVQTAGSVFVYSDQPGVAGHTVDLATMRCDCADATAGYAFRNNLACKHVLLAEMVVRVQAAAPRRLPPTAEQVWDDAQEEEARQRGARRLEQIAREFACE